MKPATRVRLPHADRRRLLCELGVEVFGSRAFDDVSMDDLAVLAGVSKGLPYHYFPTKGDFFVATVAFTSAQVLAASKPNRNLRPAVRSAQSVDDFLVWAAATQRAYWMFTRGGLGVDPRVQEVAETPAAVAVGRVLADMPGAGPAEVLAVRGWLGFVDAVTLQWLESGQPDREELVRLIVAVLRTALTPVLATHRVAS